MKMQSQNAQTVAMWPMKKDSPVEIRPSMFSVGSSDEKVVSCSVWKSVGLIFMCFSLAIRCLSILLLLAVRDLSEAATARIEPFVFSCWRIRKASKTMLTMAWTSEIVTCQVFDLPKGMPRNAHRRRAKIMKK
jgi:hypothetical protein